MSKALYLDDPDGHGIEIAYEMPARFGRFSSERGRFAMFDAAGRPHSGRERLDLRAELPRLPVGLASRGISGSNQIVSEPRRFSASLQARQFMIL